MFLFSFPVEYTTKYVIVLICLFVKLYNHSLRLLLIASKFQSGHIKNATWNYKILLFSYFNKKWKLFASLKADVFQSATG